MLYAVVGDWYTPLQNSTLSMPSSCCSPVKARICTDMFGTSHLISRELLASTVEFHQQPSLMLELRSEKLQSSLVLIIGHSRIIFRSQTLPLISSSSERARGRLVNKFPMKGQFRKLHSDTDTYEKAPRNRVSGNDEPLHSHSHRIQDRFSVTDSAKNKGRIL